MTYHKLIPAFICLTLFVMGTSSAEAAKSNRLELLDLFGDVFEKVKGDYVEEVEDQVLIENAINGMLTSLDPHSGYLNEKAFNEMKVQTKGEFGGLGIEVTMENGLVKIVSPIDDTPAAKAGIQSGDFISQINDEAVMGMSLSDAVERMRGPIGSEIELKILREGASEPLIITLKRDIIKIKSVRSRKEEDVAYIRITSFSEKTAGNVRKALIKLEKEIGSDLKGVVLDLRNNPGGLLDQAIEVTDIFLNQGEIVSTRGRTKGSDKRFNAHKGDITKGLPMVVLINGGSASASEIVSGALQDHRRAIILGTKSFGKGSVQTVMPLPGKGGMRLTTSLYYTPSGRSIQAEGIQPDIIVELAKLEKVDVSNQSESNLLGHIKNAKAEKDNKDKKKGSKADQTEVKKDPLYERDYQLARAVDLLRGIYYFSLSADTPLPIHANNNK